MSILSLNNIEKNFGAIQALIGVSFDIKEAETVGLMGDNGAGKSTLLKIIAGNFKPSGGEIKFENNTVVFEKPLFDAPFSQNAPGVQSRQAVADVSSMNRPAAHSLGSGEPAGQKLPLRQGLHHAAPSAPVSGR